MINLFIFRDKLKEIYASYGMIIRGLIKFIVAMSAALILIQQVGYMQELATPMAALVIGLASAFLPYSGITLILGAFMLVHVAAVSTEMAALIALIMIIVALLYYGFQPKDSYILILVPMCFFLRIPYVMPLILGLAAGPVSVIPLCCGIIIYYVISYFHLNVGAITADSIMELPQKYIQIINASLSNKTMLVLIIAFSITMLLVFLLHNLSIDYAWYIAIGAGVISLFIAIFVGEYAFDVSMPIPELVFGVLVSALISLIYTFFVFSVDYSGTEYTQFEDDDYYYYVKAVPKITVSATDIRVKVYSADKEKKEGKISQNLKKE